MAEIVIQKEYKTITEFVKDCRASLTKVFGNDTILSTTVSLNNEMSLYLAHRNKKYGDVLTETGRLTMSKNTKYQKCGFDFRFDDFIYVYNIKY